MKRALPITILALFTSVAGAGAQSIFATSGLGVPVPPVDARTQALGGIGVGLLGYSLSLVNPAEVAGFPFRGVAASMQTSSRSIEFGGQSDETGANRFPLLRVIYPVGERTVATIGYGAFLDQSWAISTQGTEVIGPDTIGVRDAIESDGGLAQLHLGVAYLLTPSFAVGAAGGLYTGQLRRTISRSFDPVDRPGFDEFRQTAEWTQRAPFLSGGFRWDPTSIVRLAGSVTWTGDFDVEVNDARAQAFEFELPLQVAVGASAIMAPGLTGAVSARWSGWSKSAPGSDPAQAPDDTWEIGGGIEWKGASVHSRGLPIRIGYRRAQLPFRFNGETPTEWTATLGTGLELVRTDFGPLAVIDAALDRGSRNTGNSGPKEDFWRFTLSVGVFGR